METKDLLSKEEKLFYKLDFEKVWDCSNIEKRDKVHFWSLSNEFEKEMLSQLINYILYYYQNKFEVDKIIIKNEKNISAESIINYWYSKIGKPQLINDILNFQIYTDCIKYFETQKNRLNLLSTYFKAYNIYEVKEFRNEDETKEFKSLLRYNEFSPNNTDSYYVKKEKVFKRNKLLNILREEHLHIDFMSQIELEKVTHKM